MNLRSAWYFAAGIGFLALAKAKHSVAGYTTPRPFAASDIDRCIEYDAGVVDSWLAALASYTGSGTFLAGRNVLELGPGSDLGVGILLLARGARTYYACDVHDLAVHAPRLFYDVLFERLAGEVDVSALRRELELSASSAPSRLHYTVQQSLDLIEAVGPNKIDIVFSQAAFEHFEDIASMVQQLTAVCRPGAVLVTEIDLKTHSRWIRDKDPNNIYRFPDPLYRAFHFRGAPNRLRPHEYREAFERCGWSRVEITPLTRLARAASGLSARFVEARNQMEYLTVMMCATRTAA